MKEKVVLAYSGGLDTTTIIPWLKEKFDYEVICCCIDVGQGAELDGLDERAKLSGASKLYIENVIDEFCDDFIMPCVQANAVYEHIGGGIVAVNNHQVYQLQNRAPFPGIVPGGASGTADNVTALYRQLFIKGQAFIMDILHDLGHDKELYHAGRHHGPLVVNVWLNLPFRPQEVHRKALGFGAQNLCGILL